MPSNNAFLYNLFTPQVSVSYVPDVFGLNRRTVESLQAQEQAARFQMIAAAHHADHQRGRRRDPAGVVAGADRRDARTRRHQHARWWRSCSYQLAKGYAGRLDLAAQESQLAQVNATLPPLLKQLASSTICWRCWPAAFRARRRRQTFDLASLQLPQDLPLSLPSTLVAQRPDVRQAEANMHAASAQIGVAIANRLPNILLTANAGSTALAIGQVFKSGTGFWSLGADLAAPIFQGGTLLHQERAAKAAYVQAAEQYRSTVLTAFQNVADTLAALSTMPRA